MKIVQSDVLDIDLTDIDNEKVHIFNSLIEKIQPVILEQNEIRTNEIKKLEEYSLEKKKYLIRLKEKMLDLSKAIEQKQKTKAYLKKIEKIVLSGLVAKNQQYEMSVLVRNIENVDTQRVERIISNYLS